MNEISGANGDMGQEIVGPSGENQAKESVYFLGVAIEPGKNTYKWDLSSELMGKLMPLLGEDEGKFGESLARNLVLSNRNLDELVQGLDAAKKVISIASNKSPIRMRDEDVRKQVKTSLDSISSARFIITRDVAIKKDNPNYKGFVDRVWGDDKP